MQLSLYNSLSKEIEIFQPYDKNDIKMYVCGPTVYDRAHIGNARSVIVYDMLFRLLKFIYGNESITYVRNITDIDDKIINKAKEGNLSIKSITKETINFFQSDMAYLKALSPTIQPRATNHVAAMIDMISKLIQNGSAYCSNNHVYFKVSSAKNYTQLTSRDLDQMQTDVRIESSEGKHNVHDFVLWKPEHENDPVDSNFNSPWGMGRPGWHIECSAMSNQYLGTDFDIHGGGIDLIFPHHTNEIAQSTCAYPDTKFAKYWVHNGFLTVNKQKMSKSLGNFITVKDLIEQHVDGEVVRLFLLSTHYRKPLDYNKKAVEDAKKTLNYMYGALTECAFKQEDIQNSVYPTAVESLCEDLNIAIALRHLNELARQVYKTKDIKLASMLYSTLHLLGFEYDFLQDNEPLDAEIELLINSRKEAKNLKDWLLADQIRKNLSDRGVKIIDLPDGSCKWIKEK